MKAYTSLSDQIHINLPNQVGIEFKSYIRMYMDTSRKWRSFFKIEVVVRTNLSQFEIEKYKFIIIYPNLLRRTRPCTDGLEGPGRRAAEGAGSAPSANSDMEEGWICDIAAMLWMMASIVLSSMTTVDTAAVLVSISNRSEEGNGSETLAGSDIEG